MPDTCKNCGSQANVKAIQAVPGTTAWVLLCRECRKEVLKERVRK